jgi:hypothetical protein
MRSFVWLAIPLAAAGAWAQQQNTPHAGYVYPAGARVGTTVEVVVGGQFLDGASNAYVSGEGVQALVTDFFKPMGQGPYDKLREELQGLQEKRKQATAKTAEAKQVTFTTGDEKRLAELREMVANAVRRPATPAISEQVTVRLTVAADAALGERELRLATPTGMTNPVLFCIGQLAEFARKPAKVVDEQAAARFGRFRTPEKPEGPVLFTLPAVINGQTLPGAVDKFQFRAAQGQKLVVAARARALIPYISDAVPGWFQATVALYNAAGKELQYGDHFRFHPDPVLYYEIPEDGEYTLAVHDSIYRGREDFVYRIEVGELPYLTAIFPLGAKTGGKTPVELQGWNLPPGKLVQNAKRKQVGLQKVSVRRGNLRSNDLPFELGTLPERKEKEPNDTARNAMAVKLPVVVNGRIGKAGDQDVFRFDGKAGDEIVAEVYARRLESPLDSSLRLTSKDGKQLAANDDFEDKGAGLLTHHADSRILFTLPAKGTYYLWLGDTQHKGGPEYAYRLRIGRPQPDFELRMTPASVSVRPGMTVAVTVYALRRDGFTGEIALKLKDAPTGFQLGGAWIPANQDRVRMTLSVPASRIERPRPMELEGRATIAGKEARRLGVPAEDMMQAFAYRHLVPAHEWMVRVTGQGRGGTVAWKMAEKPVRLAAGGTTAVHVFVPMQGGAAARASVTLNEPPEGFAVQSTAAVRDGVSMVLKLDAAKVKPGMAGNLIVNGFVDRTVTGSDGKANRRRQPAGVLPAIPFEVVAAGPD